MTTGAAESAAAGRLGLCAARLPIALAVDSLLSIVASVWARVSGTDRRAGAGRGTASGRWARRLLALPDAIVVFVASPALYVWDKARSGASKRRARAMCAMVVMMAA